MDLIHFGSWFIAICIFVMFMIPPGKRLLTRSYKYFCSVLAKAKKRIASKRSPPSAVTQLQSYSAKMMKWSYECDTNYDFCDDSDCDTHGAHVRISKATKSTQTDKARNPSTRDLSSFSNCKYKEYGNNNTDQGNLDSRAIRQIQERQCNQLLKQLRFLDSKDVKTPLLICVETNSTNIAGYCINFNSKTCKFYVYGVSHLPWNLETSLIAWDTTEFKMKNLVFGLLLWEQEIIQMKKFSIYVNCWAVNDAESEYGKVPVDFMEHFTSCHVTRVNSNANLSKHKNTEAFAQLMQPASELVHFNLTRFRKFIRKAYGITNFEGSHMFMDDYSEGGKDDGYFAKSYRYHHFLNMVDKNLKKWSRGCKFCGFRFPNSFQPRNTTLDTLSSALFSDIVPYPLSNGCW